MDGLINSNLINPEQRVFDGLAMREAGVLHLNVLDIIRGSGPYHEHKVERHTTWVYQSGHPVFELIDPAGQVFVMQSYSIQRSALNEDKLSELGHMLSLPKGWQFKSGVLKTTNHLITLNDKAVVVQDDLLIPIS